MRKNRITYVSVSIIVSLICICLLLSKVSFVGLYHVLAKINLLYLIPLLILSFIGNIAVSAERFRIILRVLGASVSFRECFLINTGSNIVARSLPLRAGETSRVIYLKRMCGLSVEKSLLAVISEYVSNAIAVLSFMAAGFAGIYFAGKSIFFLGGSLRFTYMRQLIRSTLFKDMVSIVLNKYILLLSFIMWGIEFLDVYIIFRVLHTSVPVSYILFSISLSVFITNLPIFFFGIGAREYSFVVLFAKFSSPQVLVSAGLLYSFVEYLFPFIFSAFFTPKFITNIVKYKKVNFLSLFV